MFSYLKQENYKSIFERDVNALNLVCLTIPKTEKVQWEKENEIIYMGKYYDVFSQSEDSKNYFLVCYSDSRDNLLCEGFNKHIQSRQNENASGKNHGNSSVKIIIQDFVLHAYTFNFSVSSGQTSISQISFSPASGIYSVFSPPPEQS